MIKDLLGRRLNNEQMLVFCDYLEDNYTHPDIPNTLIKFKKFNVTVYSLLGIICKVGNKEERTRANKLLRQLKRNKKHHSRRKMVDYGYNPYGIS